MLVVDRSIFPPYAPDSLNGKTRQTMVMTGLAPRTQGERA